jgi:hypothetical protein
VMEGICKGCDGGKGIEELDLLVDNCDSEEGGGFKSGTRLAWVCLQVVCIKFEWG